MSDFFAYSAMPGPGAVSITTERNALLGPITWYLLKGIIINGSAASDAGNTPTTELRHGLLMGQRTSDNFFANYGPAATDGTQQAVGFLWEPRSTIDTDGNTVNRPGQVVIAGYVKASQILLLDEQSRRQMQGRFIFDDRLVPPYGGFSNTVAKTANYTLVNTDNNTHFTTSGNAGAIVFTLPALPLKGFRVRFTNVVGQNMTITAPAGKLYAFNNAAATNIAFTTASNLIGASVEILVDDTGNFYIACPFAPNTATVT